MECEHVTYFRDSIPQPGELIWCTGCQSYTKVGPVVTQTQWTYHPECSWRSRKRQRMFTGQCAVEGCTEPEHKSHNWYLLRTIMEKHYRRTHIANPLPPFVMVDLLPPNSPPPF